MTDLRVRASRVPQITLSFAKSHIWLAALVCLLLALSRPASADTLYIYIGDNFNDFQGPPGEPNDFTSTDHLFVSFTIAGPPLICLTACTISATDLCIGVQNQQGAHGCGDLAMGSLQTDSSGKIVAWDFTACFFARDGGCEDELIFTNGGGGSFADGAEFGEFIAGTHFPGAWFLNVPSPVPEPTTLLTCASGLVFLAGAVRRKRN